MTGNEDGCVLVSTFIRRPGRCLLMFIVQTEFEIEFQSAGFKKLPNIGQIKNRKRNQSAGATRETLYGGKVGYAKKRKDEAEEGYIIHYKMLVE